MFAQRPIFFEPRPAPSFHVPLLSEIPICDNCASCILWKQLMAMCDIHEFRTELPIGLLDEIHE
jgi:hypothetical protein